VLPRWARASSSRRSARLLILRLSKRSRGKRRTARRPAAAQDDLYGRAALLPHLIPAARVGARRTIIERTTARLRGRITRASWMRSSSACRLKSQVWYLTTVRRAVRRTGAAAHPWSARGVISTEVGIATVLLLGAGHCFRDQVVAVRAVSAALIETVQRSMEQLARDHPPYGGIGDGYHRPAVHRGGGARPVWRADAIRPFADPPRRHVALAWRVSFPRPSVEALRRAVRPATSVA
jgi:hypothetical protein